MRIEFPRGISALVGPNGSGKSNVVDAIRWCLGEQSMRDLRGQRAEDVIYAGPRRALGAAEVTLTLESEEGDAVDWAELAVSRRLFRSGESEYLINGRRARLRDVVAALADAGIDSSRYVVVTQGMADALLAATPLERRALLEQAAGLSAYRERRDDARQKLATAARNVETIEAVLAELEPRVRMLKRQARAVVEREEAVVRLRAASLAWYGKRWHDARGDLRALSHDAEAAAAQRCALQEQVAALEREADRQIERERDWHQRLQTARAALHEAERSRDGLAHGVAREEQHLKALQETHAVLEERRARLLVRHAEAGEALEALEEALNRDRQTLAFLAERTAELESERSGVATAAVSAERAASEAARASTRAHREQAEREQALRDLSVRVEADREQLDGLETRLRALEESITADRQHIDSLEQEVQVAQRERDQSRANVSAAEKHFGDTLARKHRYDEVLRRVRAETAAVRSRRESSWRRLERLEVESGGTLAAVLRVTSGWEEAVAGVLGGWANEQSEALNGADTAGFQQWRDGVDTMRPSGSVWADEVVSGWPGGKFNVLGGALLVEREEEGRGWWQAMRLQPGYLPAFPPLCCVSRGGVRIDAAGERRGGHGHAVDLFTTRSRWEQEGRRAQTLEARLARIEEGAVGAAAEADKVVQTLGEARAAAQDAEERFSSLSAALQQATATLEGKKADMTRAHAAVEDTRARLEERTVRRERVEAEVRRCAENAATLRSEAERLAAIHQESARRLTDAEAEVHRLRADSDTVRASIAGHERLASRHKAEVESTAREIDEIAAQIQRTQDEIANLTSTLAAQTFALQDIERLAIEARDQLTAVEAKRPNNSADAAALAATRRRATEAVARHERIQAALESKRRAVLDLGEEVRRELGLDPDTLVDAETAPGEEEMRRLRRAATQYADADPGVVVEAREMEERRDYLQRHASDLQQAMQDLRTIMERADAEMQHRFRSAFGSVDAEFRRVFAAMLPGGEARLNTTEDGGVDISARLPGKRARSSASFSGGERSLIATALLFGVLRIRPTPFCVLDEVDAALDEANVDRYLTVLRDISKRTQSIVVTHNRATMETADILYGLTMDDDGQSGVLSLRLDAYGAAV